MTDYWTDAPTLSTDLIQLRPLVRDDRHALLTALSDGKLWEPFFSSFPAPDQIDQWLDDVEAGARQGRRMALAVIHRPSGQLIGSTSYCRMNKQHRRLEIGYTFYAASYQRGPVNSQAKRLLLTHAFDVMDCLCVQIRTNSLNQRSRRAIERLGAQLDGVLRHHVIDKNGLSRDTAVYSIIDSDWPVVKANLDYLNRER